MVNIGHFRIKECDRLSAVVNELIEMGARVEEFADSMIIHGDGGASLLEAEIETYNDHRIAMSFAVAVLRVPYVHIMNEECVARSFPHFWESFGQLK